MATPRWAEAAAICAYVAERYPEAKSWRRRWAIPPRAKTCTGCFLARLHRAGRSCSSATKIEMDPAAAGWSEAQRVFDVLDAAVKQGSVDSRRHLFGRRYRESASGLNFAVRMFKMVPTLAGSFDAYLYCCAARPAFQRAEKLAAG